MHHKNLLSLERERGQDHRRERKREMGYSKMSTLLILAVAMAMAMAGARVAEAQTPACAQQLVPCAEYLNSTNPPASCCDPLRRVVTEERDCLCNLYNNPGLLTSLGINISQARLLPDHCGFSADNACVNASGPTSSTTPPPPGESGGENNGVGRIASVGAATLLLFWSLIVLY